MNLKAGDACPICEVGKLIIKGGKYSDFLACDMYRHTGCQFAKGVKNGKEKGTLEMQADEFLKNNNLEYLIL